MCIKIEYLINASPPPAATAKINKSPNNIVNKKK